MELSSIQQIGIFLALGTGLLIVVLLLLRVVPRLHPMTQTVVSTPIKLNMPTHNDAVMVVQSGRIIYMNDAARELFNIGEEEPNLERLARKARPSDAFLGLCAAEGQNRFSLSGRYVEGTSYVAPSFGGMNILVTLRRPLWSLTGTVTASDQTSQQVDLSSQAFSILTELTKTISSSLDLESTLVAILEGVERVIPFDISEITVWSTEYEHLIPYRFQGETGGERHLDIAPERYRLGEGFSGKLAVDRTPLLIGHVDEFHEARPVVDRRRLPFQSYLGVPLLVAGELIGTLEFGAFTREHFSRNDLEMLRLIAGQAAVAVHNALVYQTEQQRATELSGLANLAQAVSGVRDSQELFSHLIDSITPLLSVKALGFLVYDESRHTLEAQAPFVGVQDTVLVDCRTSIAPQSQAEKLLLANELVATEDAFSDPRLAELNLHIITQSASLHSCVLAPLNSGGRPMGYLLAADKLDATPFDQDDFRLLAIITGQAAPIIENATLVQQSRRRAQRAETLRRIASLMGSSATVDEVLKFSIVDLVRLVQADMAAIFLMDETRGELRVHRASLHGVEDELTTRFIRISVDDPDFPSTVTGSKQQFINGDLSDTTNVATLYRPLIEQFKLRSVIDVPLIVREQGIGEVILGSYKLDYFTRDDLLSVSTAAGQLAAAVEQASLYSQTDQSLRQRVDQLTALTRISRELNSTLELNHLLQRVFDEAVRTTRATCGTILLFDLYEHAVDNPKVMVHLGDEIGETLHPLEQIVLEEGDSLIIEDFEQADQIAGAEFTRHRSPEFIQQLCQPMHTGTRSALIVPIAYQGQVAGLMHLHSNVPERFDNLAREIGESLAIQAAIALGNAHRYQEQVQRSELLNRRVETLSRLFQTSRDLQIDQPLEESLESIAYAIQATTPFEIVLISVYDRQTNMLQRMVGAGIPLPVMADLKAHQQPWDAVQVYMQEKYRRGESFFIPQENRPEEPESIHTITLIPKNGKDHDANHWQADDLLVNPLLDAKGQPLGMISVDAPRNGLRPDRATTETLGIFASHAALAIESQQRLKILKNRLDTIETEMEHARSAAQEARQHLPTLLHKDLDHTLFIQGLKQRARRINAGLDTAGIVNRQTSRSSVLLTLGQEILNRMDFDLALLAEPTSWGPRLIHSMGAIPANVNIESLLGQRNPLRQSLQSGELMLVSRLEEAPEWQNVPLLNALEIKAFICLPIQAGAKSCDSILLAGSRTVLTPFSPEDRELFTLLAHQVSIALQNLNLLDETHRRLREVNLLMEFSRQLGSLDVASVLQALVESAMNVVPAAQMGMTAMWDANQQLLLPRTAIGYANPQRLMEITYEPGEALPGQVYKSGQPVLLEEVEFGVHYNLSSDDLARYRDATAGQLPVSSLAVPIKSATQTTPLGVLVLDNAKTTVAFTAEDQALLTTLAQQTALTLENVRLYLASEQRAQQLQALTTVAASLTSSLQTGELVATLLDQLRVILPYNTGTLWLRQGTQLFVRAAKGFADSEQRLGLAVEVQDSALLKEMLETGRPISVANVCEDARFPSLMDYEHLSWLGVPLLSSGDVIGVIALEKTEPYFYAPEHIQVAMTFASQAAVALENATLYQESVSRAAELDQRSQFLAMLNRLSQELSGSLDVNHILTFAIQQLFQVIHCSAVSAITFDPDGRAVLEAEYPPSDDDGIHLLPDVPLFERLHQTQGIFNTEDVSQETELKGLEDFLAKQNTHSLLVLSLAAGNELHGLLLAHTDVPYRFDPDEVELARTISNQVAVAVQNARLFAETRSLSYDLERRVAERTAELAREHMRTETLLRIITELSSSLDLDQVLNRTLQVLNEMIDAEQITVLIARPGEKNLHRLASVGYADPISGGGGAITPFTTKQGLAGWVISHRQAALIDNVLEDPRWVQVPEQPPSEHRSALAVPLMIGAEALGTLLLFHREEAHFSADQLDLVQAAANQVAVAVNNAELYRLIRDQAEDLGAMLRNQQIETSRSKAILESVADGVLVTDANKQITLFNAAAENILGLKRQQALGKSLDTFAGLFGSEANAWRETINNWSQDTTSYSLGDSYAQQITLENGSIVAVHLSPVILRSDFLGTVSIFQDITHQVEVDRLKSEFVATVSHELRTPMTSIKGYVEILLMGAAGQLSEQQSRFLGVVKQNTERLAVLVNDLLDISRIESGKITLSMQAISLEELAEEAIQDIERRSQEENKPVIINREIQTDLPRVYGDIDRVRQMIENLMDNAYLYNMPDGHITLRMQQCDNEVQIDVKDTGMGITKEEQPRIFERFFRGESPLALGVSGTGLGLSIVERLVNMHNGRIWLESTGVPGEGSTFSFTLPVYDPNVEVTEAQAAVER